MGTPIDTIVTVVITKGGRQVPLPGFGVPVIFGSSNRFSPELFRLYSGSTGLTQMVADGFLTSDPEYKRAALLVSQVNKPVSFVIAKNTAPVAQVDTVQVTTVANTTLYTVTINLVSCSYTSDGSATGAEIQAGLIAAINASSQAPFVTAAPGTGTDVVITSDEAGLGFSTSVTANLTLVASTPNHSIADDILALQQVMDLWYAVIISSNAQANIEQVAAFIQTQKKIFGASTLDAGVLTSSTSDVASVLKGKAYDRSFILWSALAAQGPEAAWIGQMVPLTPGSATWKFKSLAGVTADNLNSTQVSNAQGKNANLYLTVGGVDITTEGVMASGEYIDVTVFIDWLVATIQANVYSVLVNAPKVPYTNKGIAAVENAVRQSIRLGIDNGGLADDPAPVISVPDASSVISADKASRTLNNVVFTATLAGAIHKVNIQGFVSV